MSDDEDSDDSEVFSSSSSEDEDTVEKKRAKRREYRSKQFMSKGVLSKEWIACRDAMKKNDITGYAKLVALLRKYGKSEPLHGSWGGKTLLHHAARYGCMNCVRWHGVGGHQSRQVSAPPSSLRPAARTSRGH